MKVAFVSNLFPDTTEPYRGLDNATVLHHLPGCEIRAIAPRPQLPFRSSGARSCRPVDAPFQPVYPAAFYIPKVGSLFNHRLFATAIRKPLLQLREKFSYDAILCAWTYPDAAAVARLQSELKVPFVAIVQGSDAHVYLRMASRRPIIVDAMNQASAVITRSAKLAHLLQESGVAKEKLHPVYNGVDLQTFRPEDPITARKELGLDPSLPVLLFVGNLFPIKNPLLLVKAHAALCQQSEKLRCQLVMVGGGPMEGEIRRVADEGGFGNLVILAGRKIAREVARYMQAADLLCMSSDNEGVPNVILEAFASGIPVLSTDVGGISEVLTNNVLGRLVPRGELEPYVRALQELLSRPVERAKIRAHGETFSWNRTAKAYADLLTAAVKA
jgi:teichuronic acid biosynthesis glycosyltransferase TuaC